VDEPTMGFMKQLLLDLRDAVKYWKRETLAAEWGLEEARTHHARALDAATMENQRLQGQLEAAGRENQRLQGQLEAAIKFNEDRRQMFVDARRDVATMQGQMVGVLDARAQLESRIVKLQKERKFLLFALVVCVGLVSAFWKLSN